MAKTASEVTIDFLGCASSEVTQSMYLVTYKDIKILLDCGLYQSSNPLTDYRINHTPIKGLKPSEIDYIFISHSHVDIFSLKDEALTIFRRRKIGFVFQAYNLVPVLNVSENIVLPIELDGGKVNKDFVQQIVQTLGLDERLDALPNQLSGGQQQRVAIARALAAAPAIILADEPTGNLDSKTSQDVLSLLKVTSQKFAQTIVMITHNEEIAQMADRIIRIEDGRIVTQN